MYDKSLNERVAFARHAIALDETRNSFPRVKWGAPGVSRPGTPPWFEQLWFAGNHSDIGGSYIENESRLSDITLRWMVDAAAHAGMIYDASVLRTYPDPKGQQHDETRRGVFKYVRKLSRSPPKDAPLHPSVVERLEAAAVLQFDEMKPYRPECLSEHQIAGKYYRAQSPSGSSAAAGANP
jgi:hypothetical protein